ncbi:peptidase S41 [Oxalobacteraceae bacterium]|nr:peptidase S41 [Oxalobacteraceae bacterium]
MLPYRFIVSSLAVLLSLSACGGDSFPVAQPEPPIEPEPVAKTLAVWNLCQTPRTGLKDGFLPYPDKQGTLADEKAFVRAWVDEIYLWDKEVPASLRAANYATPVDYFAALKTPLLSASGNVKDRFHFTYPSAQWEEISNGLTRGYGVSWVRSSSGVLPRTWIAAAVEPQSSAALAGVQRGDQLLMVDGLDFLNSADSAIVARLNAGITPASEGEPHQLTLLRERRQFDVSLVSGTHPVAPVQHVGVIDTASGKVGYLTFNNHNIAAEKPLIAAFTRLQSEGVSDLVLDMRYNGGGLLLIANELAYMIAGPANTEGKVFERLLNNGKVQAPPPTLFRSTSLGLGDPQNFNKPLPHLDLKRVTILTGAGTCSASESVINSLRGVDVEVNLIGAATCGKPYAFGPMPNCGTTYFVIQYQGVNNKGSGDYADGFAPTCGVADDFRHALGDVAEGQLAAALHYRASGSCPGQLAGMLAAGRSGANNPLRPVRPELAEIAIRGVPR